MVAIQFLNEFIQFYNLEMFIANMNIYNFLLIIGKVSVKKINKKYMTTGLRCDTIHFITYIYILLFIKGDGHRNANLFHFLLQQIH